MLGIAASTIQRWPDTAELAVRIARQRVHAQEDVNDAQLHLAHVLAFRGHLREALALGDTLPGNISNEFFAEAALLGYVPADRAQATFSRWLQLGEWPPFLPVPALALPWWGIQRDTVALRRSCM